MYVCIGEFFLVNITRHMEVIGVDNGLMSRNLLISPVLGEKLIFMNVRARLFANLRV